MKNIKENFLELGFAKLENLVTPDEVEQLRVLYDGLLTDKRRTRHLI